MNEKSVVRLIGTVPPDRFGKHLAAVCSAQQASVVQSDTTGWTLGGPLNPYLLLRELLPWTRNEGAIILFSRSERPVRAFLFDLDATLTACEFLDTLADELGLGDRIRQLTQTAMDGKMDFAASYRARLELLAGTSVDRIDRVIARLQLTEGAERLCGTLHRRGTATAIVTGGYARVGRAVQQRLGIRTLYATELEERVGKLTGRPAGKLIDETEKVRALDDFCRRNGCQRTDCAVAGDGANDLRMLAAAGRAVLYSALPAKRSNAMAIDRLLEFPELTAAE